MNDSYPWFGLVHRPQLEQGDFFVGCPIFRPGKDGLIRRETGNVIVLSQSCDLAHDKLEIVQVCPYWPLELLAAEVAYLRSKRGRENLRHGNIPGYHLLNRCNLTGFETDYLICDFRSLFGVHLTTLKDLAAQQSPRLRLLPPYREHLAQAFARFFMRVGCPLMFRRSDPDTGLGAIPKLFVARLGLPSSLPAFHGVIGRDVLRRWEYFRYEGRRQRLIIRDKPHALLRWLTG